MRATTHESYTDNVKLRTANQGLPFAVRWPNLDLEVSKENTIGPLPAEFKKWFITLRAIFRFPEENVTNTR